MPRVTRYGVTRYLCPELNSDAAKRTASHSITRYVLIAPCFPCRKKLTLSCSVPQVVCLELRASITYSLIYRYLTAFRR